MAPIHNQARGDPDRRVGGTAAKVLLKIRPALREEGSRSVSDQTRPDQTRLAAVRPAGFEPATKGFKGPRVSARLGLSHPPPSPIR